MKYTVGQVGRSVVVRLEHGEPVYGTIEKLAEKEDIAQAVVLIIGGVMNAGVIVGPESTQDMPPKPVVKQRPDAHEILGMGTLVRDSTGKPKLHLHAGLGRGEMPLVGCPREGLDCWLINEVVILEMTGMTTQRVKDERSGFELLEC